ncbi:MAG: transglycosylase SLT domain-containing protein [Bryobacteraceae bacterium]
MGWTIRALSFETAALLLIAASAGAQDLETAARAYRTQASAARRAAVLGAAKPPALGSLALAAADLEARRMPEALAGFLKARKELPLLADHAEYGAAQALISLGRKPEALPILASLISRKPISPHRAAAIFASVDILMEQKQPDRAAALLAPNLDDVPEAKGKFLYASALEAAGDAKAAALEYQGVFFDYARAPEAAKAKEALDRLRTSMGRDYPPELPSAWLGRADQLIDAGRGKEAAAELLRLTPNFTGGDRDRAQVRIGAARYRARDYAGALQHLSGLSVSQPVLDAERLSLIASSARRLNRSAENASALRELAAKHPVSPWRLEALLGEVYQYLVANQPERYEPIYEVCFGTFARDERAGDCHWKFAWSHYLRRSPDAEQLLWNQVEKFPKSEDAPAALYFLGRVAEQRRDFEQARALYEAVSSRFPNYYYGVTSRQRLDAAVLAKIRPDARTASRVAAAGLAESGSGADFTMDEPTRVRIRRAGQLAVAAIDDWAEFELRFGASVDAKRNLIGIELAQLAVRQGRHAQGLRYAKAYSGKYLTWHIEDAPVKFWKLVFPLYYRDDLEKHSRANEIDPFIVAGLIRQESEFDPEAVSRARAIGLTQIMPATGRDLSRRLGIRKFTNAMLTKPEFNLRLGTYYLKKILDSQDGLWVRTLAGYNAGPTRANRWKTWASFREPSEFIETIPFSETRNYVQSVLRNADVYRRLWGKL